MKIFPFRQGPLEEKIDAPLFGEIHHGDIIQKKKITSAFLCTWKRRFILFYCLNYM